MMLTVVSTSELIFDVQGNKGGTAICLTLTPPATPTIPNPYPTVLTFVNTHLAAFDEMVERRNADFHDLGRRLRFDTGSRYDADGNTSFPSPSSIYESDVLIWMVRELTTMCGASVYRRCCYS
jgi:phosphatidylinositol-bisphosphatase